jgi:hypothetical protein
MQNEPEVHETPASAAEPLRAIRGAGMTRHWDGGAADASAGEATPTTHSEVSIATPAGAEPFRSLNKRARIAATVPRRDQRKNPPERAARWAVEESNLQPWD